MSHQFLVCPDCGYTISTLFKFMDEYSKYKIYTVLQDEKYSGYDPAKLFFTKEIESYKEIFDALGVKNKCCRVHLMCRSKITLT